MIATLSTLALERAALVERLAKIDASIADKERLQAIAAMEPERRNASYALLDTRDRAVLIADPEIDAYALILALPKEERDAAVVAANGLLRVRLQIATQTLPQRVRLTVPQSESLHPVSRGLAPTTHPRRVELDRVRDADLLRRLADRDDVTMRGSGPDRVDVVIPPLTHGTVVDRSTLDIFLKADPGLATIVTHAPVTDAENQAHELTLYMGRTGPAFHGAPYRWPAARPSARAR